MFSAVYLSEIKQRTFNDDIEITYFFRLSKEFMLFCESSWL